MNDEVHDIDKLVRREDLVTVADIADMGRVDEETARTWTQAENFPKPIAEPESGALYSRGAVDKWMLENDKDTYRPPTV